MSNSKQKSSSIEQQEAEAIMLSELGRRLGMPLEQGGDLPIDLGVEPDAINLENRVVVETFARLGPLKAGQRHKIKGDLLKLALIGKRVGPEWRKILCFASQEAASYLLGGSWVAAAAREFGIEVVVVELPEEIRNAVQAAQRRQVMVNPG